MWFNILTKPQQSAKFHEILSHLMNYPVDYHQKSAETMHTIMEDRKLALLLQGSVETNIQFMGGTLMDGQTPSKFVDKKQCCMHWRMPIDNINTCKSTTLADT